MFKKAFSLVIRIAVSLALLFFLFRKIDKDAFIEVVRMADPAVLVLAFFVFISCYVMALLRWEMLLKGSKVHLPFKKVLIGYCGGVFFNLFMPSTIGGDVIRSFDLANHSKKPKEVIASVLLDRLSGYMALIAVAVLAILIGFNIIQDRAVLMIMIAFVVLLSSILLFLFNNFLYSKLNKLLHYLGDHKLLVAIRDLHREIYYFRQHKTVIIKSLLLSVVIQLCFPLVFYFIAKALGIEIKLLYFYIFVPLITAITFLPISIGGLGLRDATTIFFFSKAGLSHDVSLAISLILFAYVIIIGCVGGIIYVFTLRTRRLQLNKKL